MYRVNRALLASSAGPRKDGERDAAGWYRIADHDRCAAMTERLARAITGPQYFALAFGTIVGVAWIVVMGDLVSRAGAGGTAVAIALGGVAILLIALCYAEMAARLPAAGGELVYAYALGGAPAAYFTGWTLALISTAVCAYVAIAVGKLAQTLFPWAGGPMLYSMLGDEVRLGPLLIGLVGALGVWWLHGSGGARGSARAQLWVTAARLALMALFLGVALAWAEPANLRPLVPGATAGARLDSVLAIMGTAPFLFAGFSSMVCASEESAVSMRTVGRALVAAILASAAFYIALVLSVGALVPAATLGTLELPAAEAFTLAMGSPIVAKLVLATGLLGNLTAWNGIMMAGSRVFFALSRARLGPAAFARLGRSGAPVNAIAFMSGAAILGLFLGSGFILPLVNIAATAFGVTYVVTCLALLRMRRRNPGERPVFRVPGGPPVIVLALLAAAGLTLIALVQPWLAATDGPPAEGVTIVAWALLATLGWFAMRGAIGTMPERERAMHLGGDVERRLPVEARP